MNTTHFLTYLPHLVSALIILVIGVVAAYILRKLCNRWINHGANPTFKKFIVNFIYILIVVLTVITVLAKLGVPTASLIAVLGTAGLAIGLALKDFLANVAASFIIIFLKLFKVGDYIVIGSQAGTVVEINLFVTQLQTLTNEMVHIPNGKIITDKVTNKSHYPTRRLDLTIGIAYEADITKARKSLQSIIDNYPLALKEPEPVIAVLELANSSVNLSVRVWVKRQDLLNAQFELLEQIKDEFAKANISIPYPQLDVHLSKQN